MAKTTRLSNWKFRACRTPSLPARKCWLILQVVSTSSRRNTPRRHKLTPQAFRLQAVSSGSTRAHSFFYVVLVYDTTRSGRYAYSPAFISFHAYPCVGRHTHRHPDHPREMG